MKIPQTSSGPFTRVVTLPRPDGSEWAFTIRPLPLGFHRRLRDRGLIVPTPPVKIARDSSGRPLRDESNMAVTTNDLNDPDYRRAIEIYHQRIAVLAIREAFQADPHVDFESFPPDTVSDGAEGRQAGNWAEFADLLYAELGEAGFTDGDLIILCNEIGRLSNLVGDHLRQSRSNFSSAATANTT